ncbi:MAG: trypsin-like peptidase domain-containing protein [Chloroflexota bacterium]|nr:trypsin-like peptidase domain-containing protein [Chloroflexota bacterium]
MTEPIEYQRYGPPPDEARRPAAWQAPPTWPPQQQRVTDDRRDRGPRLGIVPVLLIALVASILSGGLTALAVTNVARPGSGSPVAGATPNAQQAQSLRIDESSAVISATEKVGPAVVRIIRQSGELFGAEGVGSGFIYDPDGWIVTNRHVVEGADSLTVELQDSRQFEGQVIGVDTLTDLAVVKIDGSDLPAAPIGTSQDLKVGQLAIAIGSPLGNYPNSVTTGVVSGLGRQIQAGDVTGTTSEQLNNLIQTEAAINRGNSGGPLINSAGQVIGINTAVAATAQGIGFAIPIDIATPVMEQARNGEEISRPWIGIYYVPVTEQLRAERDLSVSHGVLISAPSDTNEPAVFPDSPAEKAGLRDGDVIVAIDGVQIDAQHELSALVLGYQPGDQITLRVLRGETERDMRVTLGTMPDQP